MVNNTLKAKHRKTKHRKTKHRTTKYGKNYRKFVGANSINRVQIGCSNNRNKVMMGGGLNAVSQPLTNIGYSMYDGITNAYNTLLGYSTQPDSNVSYQPYLI
jgi:hypothetical protein